jgi:hypothetical protein
MRPLRTGSPSVGALLIFFESWIGRRESGSSALELSDTAAQPAASASEAAPSEERDDDEGEYEKDDQVDHVDGVLPVAVRIYSVWPAEISPRHAPLSLPRLSISS